MPDRVSHLSRRGFLAAGVGGAAVAVTGCDALDEVFGDADSPEPGAVSPAAPAADADSVLVDEVSTAIAKAGALATATGTTIPALARIGLRLARIHEAHAAELGRNAPADPPADPPVVKGSKATALRRMWRTETALQDQLVAAAQAAESGALAQVFASMAAGLAQQQAVLA